MSSPSRAVSKKGGARRVVRGKRRHPLGIEAMVRAPPPGDSDEEEEEPGDASDNEEEFAQRLAFRALIDSQGTPAASSSTTAKPPTAMAELRARLVELQAWAALALQSGRATAMQSLVRLLEGAPLQRALRRDLAPCLHHGTLRRVTQLMGQAQTVVAEAVQPLGSVLQRALWACAARPPWPTLPAGTVKDDSTTLARTVALVETELGAYTGGWAVWALGGGDRSLVVQLAEWRQEEPPAPVCLGLLWLVDSGAATRLLEYAAPTPPEPTSETTVRWVAEQSLVHEMHNTVHQTAGWRYVACTLADPALLRAAAKAAYVYRPQRATTS